MNNLSKENYFDAVKEKYPDAFADFSKWIDEYKKLVDWERLFNYGSPHYAKMGWHNPKFHELPMEMQFGILARYKMERSTSTDMSAYLNQYAAQDLMDSTTNMFKIIQHDIEKSKEDGVKWVSGFDKIKV